MNLKTERLVGVSLKVFLVAGVADDAFHVVTQSPDVLLKLLAGALLAQHLLTPPVPAFPASRYWSRQTCGVVWCSVVWCGVV